MSQASSTDTPFVIAGRTYGSRLLVGTGKYKDLDETRRAIEASGAEIVTVAVRRTKHRAESRRAEPAGCDPAGSLHHPAEHRRLL
ncbi:thiazole synthase [Pseudomonas aeruginosa]|nr:thiazole synthase [Pseudomonas aeruginosa]